MSGPYSGLPFSGILNINIYVCLLPRGIMQQHIAKCLGRAEERVSWLLALEDRPFTMNNHHLSDYRSKFLAHYKGARESCQQPDLMKMIQAARPVALGYSPTGVAKVIASLAEIGMSGVRADDLAKLLPPDKMEPALEIMAGVRAYFQGKYFIPCFFPYYVLISDFFFPVAYKRFSDNIPLAIDLELVRGLESGVHSELCRIIGLSGPDATSICQKFAGEIPAVARDRADLLKKLERLESAHKELLYFGV